MGERHEVTEGLGLGVRANGRFPILLWLKPLRELHWQRGVHHLADRLALPDDSLNRDMTTCLCAGILNEIIRSLFDMSILVFH